MADYVSITWPPGALAEAQTKTMLNVPVPAGASLAASRLRQWVNRTNEERPTRAELRADVETVLDERLRLRLQIEDARKDREAIKALHAQQVREIAKLRESRDSARNLRDDYHEAYHTAENERNTLARENAQLRSELAFAKESAKLRSDSLVLRLAVPGGRAMTPPDVLAAAVQVVGEALRERPRTWDDDARAVVSALAGAGWLHDPVEVAALRAVADAARAYEDSPDDDYSGALRQAMVDALDAAGSGAK